MSEPLAVWTDPKKGIQVVWYADGDYWQGTVVRLIGMQEWHVEGVHLVEQA